jgi:hypothetical protein
VSYHLARSNSKHPSCTQNYTKPSVRWVQLTNNDTYWSSDQHSPSSSKLLCSPPSQLHFLFPSIPSTASSHDTYWSGDQHSPSSSKLLCSPPSQLYFLFPSIPSTASSQVDRSCSIKRQDNYKCWINEDAKENGYSTFQAT